MKQTFSCQQRTADHLLIILVQFGSVLWAIERVIQESIVKLPVWLRAPTDTFFCKNTFQAQFSYFYFQSMPRYFHIALIYMDWLKYLKSEENTLKVYEVTSFAIINFPKPIFSLNQDPILQVQVVGRVQAPSLSPNQTNKQTT